MFASRANILHLNYSNSRTLSPSRKSSQHHNSLRLVRNCAIQQENELWKIIPGIVTPSPNDYFCRIKLRLMKYSTTESWVLVSDEDLAPFPDVSPSFPEVPAEMRWQFQGYHWLFSKWAIAQHSCQWLPRRGTWFSCVSVSPEIYGQLTFSVYENSPCMDGRLTFTSMVFLDVREFKSKLNLHSLLFCNGPCGLF